MGPWKRIGASPTEDAGVFSRNRSAAAKEKRLRPHDFGAHLGGYQGKALSPCDFYRARGILVIVGGMNPLRKESPPSLFASALWAGLLAGSALAARDVAGLWDPSEEGAFSAGAILLARVLILGAGAGLVLAAVVLAHRGAFRLIRRWESLARWVPALLFAALLMTLWRDLSTRVLSGPAVSKSAWADPMSRALPWLLMGMFAATLRIVAAHVRACSRWSLWRTLALGMGYIGVGFLLDAADRRFYPGLYLYLHDVLAATALISVAVGIGVVVDRWGGTRRATWAALLIVFGAILADRIVTIGPRERFLLHARTLEGRRVLELWRALGLDKTSSPAGTLPVEDFREARRRSLERSAAVGRQRSSSVRNVVWLTVDTLRRDHLGCYGYQRHATSPNLDRFAKKAAVFESAHAQFPITSLSFQSMFYGRFPSATPLFQAMQGHQLDPPLLTLAETLRAGGLRTAGVPAIAGDDLKHPAYRVLGKGFDLLPSARERRDISEPAQAGRAIEYLSSLAADRFFLWVHLMGPHHPYVVRSHDFGTSDVDRYDSEIAETDRWIGRILGALADLGLEDDTVVVINADHGEAFGEHASRYHGTTLYEEQIAVPLLIHVPGLPARRLRQAVGNVDIMPTVLALMDVPPAHAQQGRNLLGLLRDGANSVAAPMSITFAEIPPAIPAMSPANTDRFAAIGERWKFIRNERAGFNELYDLVTDPEETKNRAGEGLDQEAWLDAAVSVFREESATLVRNKAEETVEEKLHRARSALAVKSIPARCDALLRLLREKDPDLNPFFKEVWDDPGRHYLLKNLIVLMAPEVLGDDFPQAAQAILKNPVSAGTLVALLEVIDRNVKADPPQSLIDALAGRLSAPHAVARRAAEVLARWGDSRGRAVLEADLSSDDPLLARRAAVGLARLDSRAGENILAASILRDLADTDAVTAVVNSLTRLRSKTVLRTLLEVAQNRYLHYEIKRAILRYFESLDRLDEGEFGLVGLLAGWDPEVGRLVGETVTKRLGKERLMGLRDAARRADSAKELGKQGRALDAAGAFLDAAADMRTPQGRGRFLLEAGRQAWLAGTAGQATLKNVLQRLGEAFSRAEGAPVTALSREIEDLRRRTEDVGAPPKEGHLRVMQVLPLCRRPLWSGQEIRFEVTVQNTGTTFLSGGDWPGAVRLAVVWPKDAKAPPSPAMPVPFGGIAPGETVRVYLDARAPARAGVFSATVRVQPGRKGAWAAQVKGARCHRVSVVGADPAGIEPRGLTLSGRDLLTLSWRSPALIGGVVNNREEVELEAVLVDPILTLPPLKSVNGPLTLRVELALDSLGLLAKDEIECYASWNAEGRFRDAWRRVRAIRPDGTVRRLEFHIPPNDRGMSPRFLRIDPGTFPHLVTIKSVRILP